MYRQYEDPVALERQLKELKQQYNGMKLYYSQRGLPIPEEEEWNICQEIEELRERINFAWQDDEYDCEDEL